MSRASNNVYVVGVGMTKFTRPGERDYPQMAAEAVTRAVEDGGIAKEEIQQACVGYVYGESTSGQRAMSEAGVTGVPVYNVNNNCATGATALMLAKQVVESGNSDCVLALGFEKMERGPLSPRFPNSSHPLDRHLALMADLAGMDGSPLTAQLFGNAGLEYMRRYGATEEHLARIAVKNHKHSVNNPYAQFQREYSLEEIINSPKVFGPLTRLQCCPTTDGAAAAILASEEFVINHNLRRHAVLIVGMEMCTDLPSTFGSRSMMSLVGYDMTRVAADRLFMRSGRKPADVDVVELHDCFSANELISYEALGLCPIGRAAEFIDSGGNTYGGRHVVNPSGGLMSKGHPLGATGVAQCCELCWQVRGVAGRRQVPGARLALQHNIGLGGAVVVALYTLGYSDLSGTESTLEIGTATGRDKYSTHMPQNKTLNCSVKLKSNL